VGIVVDVEATPARKTDEINATKTMIDRVEERFDLKPDRLIGDTNYGTAEILGWMVDEKQIELQLQFEVSKLDSLPQVDIVYGYANMNRLADAFVAAGDKGLVHAGVGDGSLARPAVEPSLIEAR
jgi:L-asparaginase/Glu-tRNA(Gln) amidotransferase subunit D